MAAPLPRGRPSLHEAVSPCRAAEASPISSGTTRGQPCARCDGAHFLPERQRKRDKSARARLYAIDRGEKKTVASRFVEHPIFARMVTRERKAHRHACMPLTEKRSKTVVSRFVGHPISVRTATRECGKRARTFVCYRLRTVEVSVSLIRADGS